MPTLNIRGIRVRVDDSFPSLSPEEQNKSVEEIVGHLGEQAKATLAGAGQAPTAAPPNLDPAQVPPREMPQSFRETLGGTVGQMLNGVPVVGPALLGAGERLAAAKHSVMEGVPYAQALENVQTKQENFGRNNPVLSGSAGTAGAAGSMLATGGTGVGARALGIAGRNLATRSLASAGTGAAVGGADAYARGNDPVQGAEVGGVAGAVAPVAGQAVGSVMRRALTPLPISPERQAMVNALANEGIAPTAGQITGRARLQAFEQEFGGHRFQRAQSDTADQFTRAVLRRAGVHADRATPDVMDRAFTNIGQEFDGLAARTVVPVDTHLQNDLLTAVTDYQAMAGMPAPVVEQAMNRVNDVANQNGGVLQGQSYQNIRSWIGARIRAADGPTQIALRDIQESLDDSVARNMSTADRAQWQNARRRYRNLLVVERAATGGGEEAAMGGISPPRLRQAAVGQNRRAYVRGRDDFSDLGHAGQAIMTLPPRSGTPERLAVRGIPALLGSFAGGSFGPQEAAMGFMAGTAAPYALGRTVLSGPMQRYLTSQRAVAPAVGNAAQRAVQAITLGGPLSLYPPPPPLSPNRR